MFSTIYASPRTHFFSPIFYFYRLIYIYRSVTKEQVGGEQAAFTIHNIFLLLFFLLSASISPHINVRALLKMIRWWWRCRKIREKFHSPRSHSVAQQQHNSLLLAVEKAQFAPLLSFQSQWPKFSEIFLVFVSHFTSSYFSTFIPCNLIHTRQNSSLSKTRKFRFVGKRKQSRKNKSSSRLEKVIIFHRWSEFFPSPFMCPFMLFVFLLARLNVVHIFTSTPACGLPREGNFPFVFVPVSLIRPHTSRVSRNWQRNSLEFMRTMNFGLPICEKWTVNESRRSKPHKKSWIIYYRHYLSLSSSCLFCRWNSIDFGSKLNNPHLVVDFREDLFTLSHAAIEQLFYVNL